MKFLIEASSLKCPHKGVVRNKPSQKWVTIENRSVLVENDPEGRDIDRCPFHGPPGTKSCGKTLPKVTQGYSAFIRIDRHAVCLDNLLGFTDGVPPGFKYNVVSPEQNFVAGAA
jgi:hypothetical protein